MSLSDNGDSREGRTDGTRFDLGQLLVIVYQRLFGGKAPTSIPPHPEGQDASQPPTQQLPVSLHPNPLQVLRPLPDLMLAVELVSGEGGRGQRELSLFTINAEFQQGQRGASIHRLSESSYSCTTVQISSVAAHIRKRTFNAPRCVPETCSCC